jgi:hypothetical protein
MIEDLKEVIEYLESESLSKEEIIRELKTSINDSLIMNICGQGYGLTQETYDIWVNRSNIIRTDVKYKLAGKLMDYDD